MAVLHAPCHTSSLREIDTVTTTPHGGDTQKLCTLVSPSHALWDSSLCWFSSVSFCHFQDYVVKDSDFHFAIVSCLLAHLLSCSQLPWEPLYRKAHLARSWWSPLVKSQRGTEVHNATLWRNWILPASTEVTLELDPLSLEPWNETTALNIPEMLPCEKTWQVHPAKLQSDS